MAKFSSILCKVILLYTAIIIILLSIAVFRALNTSQDPVSEPCFSVDKDYISESRGLSKRLSQAIRFKSINYESGSYDIVEIQKFLSYIQKSFPLVHSSSFIKREVVNNLSLLYHVKGSDDSLKPYMLAGHMDVVPVDESHWDVPPFEGIIKDGFVWGRGTIDCKHIVMGILEALEFLLEKKYQPKRSFYIAFGHDEEGGGQDGARHISNLLKSRNVQLEYILDEGSFVFDEFIPGIKSPVAFVSVTEKGSLNLELKVQSVPGHSSFPDKETAIVILSKALSKLEGDVFPSMFGKGPEAKMFEELAYCAPFPLKVIFRNLWLFKYLLIAYMSNPIMSATHRTTTAVTIVSGGTKVNVLPSSASANVNLRVHPAQTIDEAVDYIRYVINDDRVKIKILSQVPPHPVSPIDTFGYFEIQKSIRQIYNDSCVVPLTLIANTDTKWYLDLSQSIYRFSLIRMLPNETVRFHGNNERIDINNYAKLINFYLHLIKNSDATHVELKHSHNEL